MFKKQRRVNLPSQPTSELCPTIQLYLKFRSYIVVAALTGDRRGFMPYVNKYAQLSMLKKRNKCDLYEVWASQQQTGGSEGNTLSAVNFTLPALFPQGWRTIAFDNNPPPSRVTSYAVWASAKKQPVSCPNSTESGPTLPHNGVLLPTLPQNEA